MSNAMSRSKSRWKGALLATVAGAVVTPLAAHAQNMTVGAYLSPLGASTPKQLKYLSPDQNNTDIPIYIYATVTGATTLTNTSGTVAGSVGAISAGQFDGLQYLYYNINASSGSLGGVAGGIDGAPVLNSTLGFNATASNGSGGGFGSQVGTVQLSATSAALGANTSVLALGANISSGVVTSTSVTDFAKPRAASAVWSDYASYNSSGAGGGTYTYKNDGTNIIVSGNKVSFLVETLNYKPTAFTASTASNSLNSTVLSAIAPTSVLNAAGFTPSNYFLDSTSSLPGTQNNATGGSLSAITKTAYTAATTGLGTVSLVDTLAGDATLDGQVDGNDLGIVLAHFYATDSRWSDGNFIASSDPTVDGNDLGIVLAHFYGSLGSQPQFIVADAAFLADPTAVAEVEARGFIPVAAVPEPASIGLGLVAGAGLIGRRRRHHIV